MGTYNYDDTGSKEGFDQSAGGSRNHIINDDVHKLWTPGEGRHAFRVLPANEGKSERWGITVRVHYNLHGSEGISRNAYLCPRQNGGEDRQCPACDEFFRTDKQDKHRRDIFGSSRFILVRGVLRTDASDNVRNHEIRDGEPVLWRMPFATVGTPAAELNKDFPERLDHPEKGHDITFTRKGKTKYDTEYTGLRLAESSPIHADPSMMEAIWADVVGHPLESLLRPINREGLAAAVAAQLGAGKQNEQLEADEASGKFDAEQPEGEPPF